MDFPQKSRFYIPMDSFPIRFQNLFYFYFQKNAAIIEEELKTNTTLHKKLVKLQQIGGLEELDNVRIKKMAKVCKRYGETINIGAGGHIKVSDRKDFETVIKAMCDYYKKGEVSGKSYGTFSGRELKEVEK